MQSEIIRAQTKADHSDGFTIKMHPKQHPSLFKTGRPKKKRAIFLSDAWAVWTVMGSVGQTPGVTSRIEDPYRGHSGLFLVPPGRVKKNTRKLTGNSRKLGTDLSNAHVNCVGSMDWLGSK